MLRLLSLVPVALLAACASPQDACTRAALTELATLDALIAEAEGNLARGYALARMSDVISVVDLCPARPGPVGEISASSCLVTQTDTRLRPRAIDPAAQRRSLAALQARRPALERQARKRFAACAAPGRS